MESVAPRDSVALRRSLSFWELLASVIRGVLLVLQREHHHHRRRHRHRTRGERDRGRHRAVHSAGITTFASPGGLLTCCSERCCSVSGVALQTYVGLFTRHRGSVVYLFTRLLTCAEHVAPAVCGEPFPGVSCWIHTTLYLWTPLALGEGRVVGFGTKKQCCF